MLLDAAANPLRKLAWRQLRGVDLLQDQIATVHHCLEVDSETLCTLDKQAEFLVENEHGAGLERISVVQASASSLICSGSEAPIEPKTMQRLTLAGGIPDALKGSIVALGNFDGFHLGHQAVVGRAIARGFHAGNAVRRTPGG